MSVNISKYSTLRKPHESSDDLARMNLSPKDRKPKRPEKKDNIVNTHYFPKVDALELNKTLIKKDERKGVSGMDYAKRTVIDFSVFSHGLLNMDLVDVDPSASSFNLPILSLLVSCLRKPCISITQIVGKYLH